MYSKTCIFAYIIYTDDIYTDDMHLSELVFFLGFMAFIVGILLVDMLVIDRKAHVVSIKEAATWTTIWILLALLFGVFLWFHGDMIHGIHTMDELQDVTHRYAAHLNLGGHDLESGIALYRHNMATSYITGYLIEKMLSIDNLFVMMMIFASFKVRNTEFQHVLNWGIFGAIVMRFIFIFVGAAILRRFEWILMIFGFFLLYSAYKMYRDQNKKEETDVSNHKLVKFLSKHFRIFPQFVGDHFFVKAHQEDNQIKIAEKQEHGKWYITPLLVTVLVIEMSDLVFAFDSIPAVFSVSLDPYVVFFSNIFAILGLRAMFFLLAAIADKFVYLKTGVCILLFFIGFKLIVGEFFHIDNLWSLAIIIFVLLGSIGLSILKPKEEQ